MSARTAQLLIRKAARTDQPLRFATVVDTSPLTIEFAGDEDQRVEPNSLDHVSVSTNDRVLVAMVGKHPVIVGVLA